MQYQYYPGCSLKGTGRAYEESIIPVMKTLGVPFDEIKDWNCCGATAYMAIDEAKAFALAARNLAMAEEKTDASGKPIDIVAPCSACYLVLNKAQHYIAEQPELGKKIKTALSDAELDYKGTVKVRHPLDIFINDIGIDAIKSKVKSPLKGMKVACYYGCQIVRPYSTFDDQNNPTSMDKILQALGAEVIDWPLKTRCCGGSLTGTINEVGVRLNYILLREAKKRGADVVATCCPLCQFNLECYQDKMDQYEHMAIPVAYFTQLMGLAFGIPKESLGFQRLFIAPELAGVS